MRKFALIVIMLLLPSLALAQGTLKVSSVYGPVEYRAVAARAFVPLQASVQAVHIGDQVRTGPGGNLILELPDSSYMVVSENSTLTIEEFWAPGIRNIVNLVMGRVRFYIQRLGGKPNPYRVQTPTALIAVRGTTFDIVVDEAKLTEVHCLEGVVTVETLGLPDREVILEPGMKTFVRPGQPPLKPVAENEQLNKNRVIAVVEKGPKDPAVGEGNDAAIDAILRDNDRRNRISDPLLGPASTTTGKEVERGKPTLRFPNP